MLSAPSLPGNGNNWRQNCFRDCRFFFFFWYMKEWGLRELLDICFCSSTQCRGWYVPPDGWNCVISRPLWCWHRNLLPHGVSWDSHHSKGGKKRLILPSMSHSNNSRLSKNICIFFHNQPSRPYSQGVFTFHNTELLLYILIQGKGCYFFLIAALSLFVCPHASTHCLLWNRWKRRWRLFKGKLCVFLLTLWLTVTVSEICS